MLDFKKLFKKPEAVKQIASILVFDSTSEIKTDNSYIVPWNVMVADDDETSGELTCEILRPHFASVVLVQSSQEAILTVRNGVVFHAAALDFNLGASSIMNGAELAKKLHDEGIVNVVGMSGTRSVEMEILWSEAKAKAIFKKPFNVVVLANYIKSLYKEAQ
jgi:DNA-binding response OmpR family regulator